MAREATAVAADEEMDLIDYLFHCGGEDIIYCDSADIASDLARMLRIDYPDVEVRASYNKVFLSYETE